MALLTDWLRDLVKKPHAGERKQSEPKVAAPAVDAQNTPDQGTFMKALDHVLETNRDVMAGRVELVSLKPIVEHFADDWSRMAPKVHRLTDYLIQKRLSPDDLCTRSDDFSYVIVFGRSSRAQARLKATLIAQDIRETLFGAGAPESMLGTADLALKEDDVVLVKPEGIETLDKALIQAGAERDRSTDKGVEWVSFEEEAHALDDFVDRLDIVFRPMWFVPKKVISTYQAMPAVIRGPSRLTIDYRVLPDDAPDAAYLRLDLRLLDAAASGHRAVVGRTGRRFLVSAPVHYRTLSAPASRSHYQAALRRLGQDVRHDLVLEVVGIDDAVPGPTVSNMIGYLGPLARNLIIRVHIATRRLERFRLPHVTALGVDLLEHELPSERLIPALDRFCETCEGLHFHSYVSGVTTRSQAMLAVASGFTFIGGQAVAEASQEPAGLMPFMHDDLYAELMMV